MRTGRPHRAGWLRERREAAARGIDARLWEHGSAAAVTLLKPLTVRVRSHMPGSAPNEMCCAGAYVMYS
jgi:hypothetical protein